jgi:hypothetical protein
MQSTHDHGCKQPFAAETQPPVVQGGDSAEKVALTKVSDRALRTYLDKVERLSRRDGHAFAQQDRLAVMAGYSVRQLRRIQVHAVALGAIRVVRTNDHNRVYPLWNREKMSDHFGHHVRSTPYIESELKHQTDGAAASTPTAEPRSPEPSAAGAEHAYEPLRQLPAGAAAVAVLKRRRVPIADVIAIAQRMLGYHATTGVRHAGRLVHGFIADVQSAHHDAAELAERKRDPDWRPPIPPRPAEARPKILRREPAFVPRHRSADAQFFAQLNHQAGVA